MSLSYNDLLRPYRVWEFTTPSRPSEKIRVAYPSMCFDCEHEYQRIVWSGEAHSAHEALAKSEAKS